MISGNPDVWFNRFSRVIFSTLRSEYFISCMMLTNLSSKEIIPCYINFTTACAVNNLLMDAVWKIEFSVTRSFFSTVLLPYPLAYKIELSCTRQMERPGTWNLFMWWITTESTLFENPSSDRFNSTSCENGFTEHDRIIVTKQKTKCGICDPNLALYSTLFSFWIWAQKWYGIYVNLLFYDEKCRYCFSHTSMAMGEYVHRIKCIFHSTVIMQK